MGVGRCLEENRICKEDGKLFLCILTILLKGYTSTKEPWILSTIWSLPKVHYLLIQRYVNLNVHLIILFPAHELINT
jgi:hypothetical protein